MAPIQNELEVEPCTGPPTAPIVPWHKIGILAMETCWHADVR